MLFKCLAYNGIHMISDPLDLLGSETRQALEISIKTSKIVKDIESIIQNIKAPKTDHPII